MHQGVLTARRRWAAPRRRARLRSASPMGKAEKWARLPGREALDDRAAGGDDLAALAARRRRPRAGAARPSERLATSPVIGERRRTRRLRVLRPVTSISRQLRRARAWRRRRPRATAALPAPASVTWSLTHASRSPRASAGDAHQRRVEARARRWRTAACAALSSTCDGERQADQRAAPSGCAARRRSRRRWRPAARSCARPRRRGDCSRDDEALSRAWTVCAARSSRALLACVDSQPASATRRAPAGTAHLIRTPRRRSPRCACAAGARRPPRPARTRPARRGT